MGLYAILCEDYVAHGRDWTRPGFRAVASHRFGNWRMQIRPKFIRVSFSLLYKFSYIHCRNVYGIEVPYSCKLGRRVVFEHQGDIVIHGDAVIGDDCIIRQGVTIGNRNLEKPFDAPVLGCRVNVRRGCEDSGKNLDRR